MNPDKYQWYYLCSSCSYVFTDVHHILHEADQEIVSERLPLLGNCWNTTGVLRDVELVTVIVT
jgi:hypothetical protein